MNPTGTAPLGPGGWKVCRCVGVCVLAGEMHASTTGYERAHISAAVGAILWFVVFAVSSHGFLLCKRPSTSLGSRWKNSSTTGR